jgi:hypothetical protein
MAWSLGDIAAGQSVEVDYYYVFGENIETTGGDGSVPEPASLALLGAGLAGIGAVRRKKQKSH